MLYFVSAGSGGFGFWAVPAAPDPERRFSGTPGREGKKLIAGEFYFGGGGGQAHQGRNIGRRSFRNPGGDKHISLDPIKDGTFVCGRLFAELDFEGLPDGFTVAETDGGVELQSRLLSARVRVIEARFGKHQPKLKINKTTQSLTLTMDFKPPEGARLVRWRETGQAYLAFALELAEPGAAFTSETCQAEAAGGVIRVRWGDLELKGATQVGDAATQNSLFEERLKREPVRMVRLSDERLA